MIGSRLNTHPLGFSSSKDEHYHERGSFCVIEDPATGIELNIPNLPFRLLGQHETKIRFPGLPQASANDVGG